MNINPKDYENMTEQLEGIFGDNIDNIMKKFDEWELEKKKRGLIELDEMTMEDYEKLDVLTPVIIFLVGEILKTSTTKTPLLPPTILYNEGWLLRIILNWFSKNKLVNKHPLNFSDGVVWFSEALLPSPFLSRKKDDSLGESWTHADGAIGHFKIGGTNKGGLEILDGIKQLIITEAKMYSKLSSGVKNASYYDQAARNVACIATILERAKISSQSIDKIGFYVLAPEEQILKHTFKTELSKTSISEKVGRRVKDFNDPKSVAWYQDWFLPLLDKIDVQEITWESIIEEINRQDIVNGATVEEFYYRCIKFNRPPEKI